MTFVQAGRRPRGLLAGPAGATPVGTFYGCGDYIVRADHIEFHTDVDGGLGNGPVYKLMDPGLLGNGTYDPRNIGPAANGHRRLCVNGTLYPGNEVWDIGSWGTERIGMSVPVQITPLGTPPDPTQGTSTNVGDPGTEPVVGTDAPYTGPSAPGPAPTPTTTTTAEAPVAPTPTTSGVPVYTPMDGEDRMEDLDGTYATSGEGPTSLAFFSPGAALALTVGLFLLLSRDRRR